MKRVLAAFAGILWVAAAASTLNAQDVLNTTASRQFGHAQLFPTFVTDAPNLVEGREFFTPTDVVVDQSATPPVLYVADSNNNRILGWRNARAYANGSTADFVIGQINLFTTIPQGPMEGRNPVGLNRPTGMAVDGQGNLYVADVQNQRILRFPRPYEQGGSVKVPDLVLGQRDFTTRAINQGGLSASSLWLSREPDHVIGLTLDAQGNLWVPDIGNNRILRFPAAVLNAGSHGASADLVLGAPNFTSSIFIGTEPSDRIRKDAIRYPSHIAFDDFGRLYASDLLGRIVVWNPPFSNNKQISRIAGVPVLIQGQPEPPATKIGMQLPQRIRLIGRKVVVADAGLHRILILPEFEQWPEESKQFSPTAESVLGQPTFEAITANRGLSEPVAGSLRNPRGVLFFNDGSGNDGNWLLVADTGNNRVIAFPGQSFDNNSAATRFLGQEGLEFGGINRVEGREVAFLNNLLGDGLPFAGGLAVDRSTSPPRLFVADPSNNRVLGFRNLWSALSGGSADLVLGQLDIRRTTVNFPGAELNRPNDSGLNQPHGVALDPDGNLWVADTGNGRVLRFPRPFSQGSLFNQKADLVIGKPNFTAGPLPVPTDTNLNRPYDIAFTSEGHLLVSDTNDHRVLLYLRENGFQNGRSAFRVFGQPDAFTGSSGNTNNKMNGPRGIAVDNDGRLYVADTRNDRVLIFDRLLSAPQNPTAARSLQETFQDSGGLRSPTDVLVDAVTGQFWVADFGGSRVVRYPRFSELQAGATANGRIIGVLDNQNRIAEAPISLATSGSGDLLLATSANRISIHVPPLVALNAANFLIPGGLPQNWPQNFFRTGTLSLVIQQFPPLCPSVFASIFPISTNFGEQTVQFNQFPDPLPVRTELGGLQVRVDGKPTPMLLLAPGQINLILRNDAPRSGSTTFEVVRPASGQVVASGQIPMADACPAFFTRDQNGIGQVAAVNQDGTINTPQNPAGRNTIISLFGTGAGAIAGAPADGALVSTALNTSEKPRVIVNTAFVPDENVQYSGLVPGQLGGLWQVNVRIPEAVPPSDKILVVLVFKSRQSNQSTGTARIETTISVKQ